jgi:CheY-like chemotaxis protein
MTGHRLLVVEDQEEIAQMLGLFFDGRGYETLIATTGAEALELGRRHLPSLILLDVGLPDTDGYTLFRQMRSSARLRYTPIIFLTKRNKKSERLAGLELGADDYIHKPFDLEELFLRVQNAINRAARESLTDARTGMPSATIVRQELALLPEESGRRALEFRVRHLGPYLDHFGPLAVTGLLKATGQLLGSVLHDCGDGDAFLGQGGDDSFTVICHAGRAEAIRAAAVERFAAQALNHYGPGELTPEGVRLAASSGPRLLPLLRLEATEISS